ncbi:Choline/ethanolaminephosphotransferase 1 [Morella rubra]|uniref:Choline/ethanolaminephosphotransferase 1 n=1 Tax=Morella rubra TaxID=262757 RepID=A0A6A1V1R5_9ROSI|nr:Choline/ethanolaminephosphotransferase 1 [Morella rubra]
MGYIGTHGVAALHRYKYSGVDHSYVAKYVLQPFWSRFVNFFPLWMPNPRGSILGTCMELSNLWADSVESLEPEVLNRP